MFISKIEIKTKITQALLCELMFFFSLRLCEKLKRTVHAGGAKENERAQRVESFSAFYLSRRLPHILAGLVYVALHVADPDPCESIRKVERVVPLRLDDNCAVYACTRKGASLLCQATRIEGEM